MTIIKDYRCSLKGCYEIMVVRRDENNLPMIYDGGVEMICPKCGNKVFVMWTHEKIVMIDNDKN